MAVTTPLLSTIVAICTSYNLEQCLKGLSWDIYFLCKRSYRIEKKQTRLTYLTYATAVPIWPGSLLVPCPDTEEMAGNGIQSGHPCSQCLEGFTWSGNKGGGNKPRMKEAMGTLDPNRRHVMAWRNSWTVLYCKFWYAMYAPDFSFGISPYIHF